MTIHRRFMRYELFTIWAHSITTPGDKLRKALSKDFPGREDHAMAFLDRFDNILDPTGIEEAYLSYLETISSIPGCAIQDGIDYWEALRFQEKNYTIDDGEYLYEQLRTALKQQRTLINQILELRHDLEPMGDDQAREFLADKLTFKGILV